MAREWVEIERGDARNGPGLPRPMAKADGTLRPVPWTNGDSWGVLEFERAERCRDGSLCLVCGEHVKTGMFFTDDKNAPVNAGPQDLHLAADNGPLHARCAKLTVAHCAYIRNAVKTGSMWHVRYDAGK